MSVPMNHSADLLRIVISGLKSARADHEMMMISILGEAARKDSEKHLPLVLKGLRIEASI